MYPAYQNIVSEDLKQHFRKQIDIRLHMIIMHQCY